MKTHILMIVICSLLLACSEDPEPTSFEGRVVYVEDDSPYVGGELYIRMNEYRLGSNSMGGQDTILTDKGNFNIAFPSNEKVDYFNIFITKYSSDGRIEEAFNPNDLDCSPYDCNDFEPGKSYTRHFPYKKA